MEMIAPMHETDTDTHWMRRALRLAERGRGRVEPNPLVGAVLVREGRILGEGFHATFGGEHAEAAALKHCREQGHDPSGATVYGTLEPCNHHGKQPPCADALIKANVQRVVVAMEDPFPQVQGSGLATLRDAGIELVTGVEKQAARWLNRGFLKRLDTGLPWVIAKWAQTVDGKIATRTGDSQWLSGEGSRTRVHQWRGEVDAIVVGPGTFEADNPQLTARHVPPKRIARRVVIAPPTETLTSSRLLQAEAPVTLAVDEAQVEAVQNGVAPEARGPVEVLALPREPHSTRLALPALMRHLADTHGATHVLVEGGAALIGSLLESQQLDELRVFMTPRLMGDDDAPAAVSGLFRDKVSDCTSVTLHETETIENDALLTYAVDAGSECPALLLDSSDRDQV